MTRKRRRHSAEFKARVGLEALKGIKTVSEIARDYEIHPVQVSHWKKELQERLPEVVYDYDANGNRIYVTDPEGRTTQ